MDQCVFKEIGANHPPGTVLRALGTLSHLIEGLILSHVPGEEMQLSKLPLDADSEWGG